MVGIELLKMKCGNNLTLVLQVLLLTFFVNIYYDVLLKFGHRESHQFGRVAQGTYHRDNQAFVAFPNAERYDGVRLHGSPRSYLIRSGRFARV